MPAADASYERESSRIDQLFNIHPIDERYIKESAKESTKMKESAIIVDSSNSINVSAKSRIDGRTGCTTAGDSPAISEPWRTKATLKLHDLPILQPPEGFRVPVFRCRTPSLSWQHCGCLSHTHLPPWRPSITWSAFERCSMDPMYRTWPNRAARRFGRPSRRTVGTQSSLDGSRSPLGILRCVVRSIDMTKRSFDQEIGASIPF